MGNRAALALVVFSTLLALVPSDATAADAPLPAAASRAVASASPRAAAPAGSALVATVVEMRMGYGPEAWKDEGAAPAPLLGTPLPRLPALYTGVYANPYASPTVRHQSPTGANYWGYNLTALIEVQEAGGGSATGDFLVAASIPAPGGAVPAKLTKDGPTTFRAQFDLDGENGRGDFAALPPGEHRVAIDVYRPAAAPHGAPERVGGSNATFTLLAASIDRPAFAFPDASLPGYSDVAAGNETNLFPKLVPPSETFEATAFLGKPNATASVVAVVGRAARTLASGLTDEAGRLAFSFQPSAVLGPDATGLVVVAAQLAGDDATGASAVLALPVSAHATKVSGVRYEDAGPAGPLATVAVTVSDPDASFPQSGAKRGRLVVTKGTHVLATTDFIPLTFASGTEREARFPADAVRKFEGLGHYGLLAVMQKEDGSFYSFATASRGYSVVASDLRVEPRERAALRVVVRNFNDNFDNETDPGLETTVALVVAGLPGARETTHELTIAEGGESALDLALPPGRREGEYLVTVSTNSGELSIVRGLTLTVAEPPTALQRAFAAIPGPGALPALVALLAGAVVAARSREGVRRR